MSGGSFDYACYRTMQFADELRNKLQEQGKDPSGEGWPNATWPTDVACKLSEIAAFADYVGALMKEAEWLYSGDTGEDTFTERVRGIEATRGVMRLERLPSNAEVSGLSTRPPSYRAGTNEGEMMKAPITQAQAWAVIAESAGWNAKELPVLPEPEYRLSPDSKPSLYDHYDMQAYGAACADHAREMALSDAKAMGKTLTYQPTDPIDFTAYQEGYMDAITEFYAAIEALKGK